MTFDTPKISVTVDNIPQKNVKEFVGHLATANNVEYRETSLDQLAKTITEASGDNIRLDATEKMIIALERAGVVPSECVTTLHANYLLEKSRV